MEKETAYDCGWRARGTDQELIAVAQEHGRQAHDMVPAPEQVLAAAKPVMTQE
jgi:predicted small metal-binding protein